jgi:pimeloyl-ACP methyl ester carboxylesterase
MGGLLAIQLGAESPDVAAVVAICPAAEWMLAEDVGRAVDGRPPRPGSAMESMRVDAPGLLEWLDGHDVGDAVERLGKPLLLVHARGDEVVPAAHSQDLYERAPDASRLLLLDGGDHRSAQHDAEVQGETLRWLSKVMR